MARGFSFHRDAPGGRGSCDTWLLAASRGPGPGPLLSEVVGTASGRAGRLWRSCLPLGGLGSGAHSADVGRAAGVPPRAPTRPTPHLDRRGHTVRSTAGLVFWALVACPGWPAAAEPCHGERFIVFPDARGDSVLHRCSRLCPGGPPCVLTDARGPSELPRPPPPSSAVLVRYQQGLNVLRNFPFWWLL